MLYLKHIRKMLQEYLKERELEITTADMKSGNLESALTRFETRIGSSMLSDVIRGLIETSNFRLS